MDAKKAEHLFSVLKSVRTSFDCATDPLQLLWVLLQGMSNDFKITNWNMWKIVYRDRLSSAYRELAGVRVVSGNVSTKQYEY